MRAPIWLTIALFPFVAFAKPGQCLGRGTAQWMVDETLVAVANPEGFENQLRANACLPLTDRPGLLFDYTQVETGFFSYTSPVYVHLGTYAAISPLSFLTIRGDAAGLVIWPLPMDGAGYFSMPGYQKSLANVALPARDATSSSGLNLTLSATLQGALPLSRWLRIVATDTFAADYFYVSGGEYYVNQRRDVVLRKSDVLLKNTAFFAVDVLASSEVTVRLGAIDDLTWVPGSGELQNIASAFVSVPIRRDGLLRDIEPYVRAGAYTAHGWRSGFTVMAGVSLAWAMPMERSASPAASVQLADAAM